MDPLPLQPGDYGGTYKLIAGEPCLDLVNTVSWPGTPREHDWLDVARNVSQWAEAVGLIGEDQRRELDTRAGRTIAEELAGVRLVRSRLRDVLWPLAHGLQPASDALRVFDVLLAEACSRRHLDPEGQRWTWFPPLTLPDLLWPVVWNAAHVLTEVDRSRMGYCPSCDWLFMDTTRNRSRRWCDMADCGSRDKALRYYHRTKPERPRVDAADKREGSNRRQGD